MPTLIDFRRRIRSVKNTQQITRAMKFVAAAKLRRAQEAVIEARPYAREIRKVLQSAISRIENPQHPLLARRPEDGVCAKDAADRTTTQPETSTGRNAGTNRISILLRDLCRIAGAEKPNA